MLSPDKVWWAYHPHLEGIAIPEGSYCANVRICFPLYTYQDTLLLKQHRASSTAKLALSSSVYESLTKSAKLIIFLISRFEQSGSGVIRTPVFQSVEKCFFCTWATWVNCLGAVRWRSGGSRLFKDLIVKRHG